MVQQLKISKSCNNIYWQPLQQTPQHKKKKKPSKLVREIKMCPLNFLLVLKKPLSTWTRYDEIQSNHSFVIFSAKV